jgi:hypothetical protein
MNFLMTSKFISPSFPNCLKILKLVHIMRRYFIFLGEKKKLKNLTVR